MVAESVDIGRRVAHGCVPSFRQPLHCRKLPPTALIVGRWLPGFCHGTVASASRHSGSGITNNAPIIIRGMMPEGFRLLVTLCVSLMT